MRFLLSLFAFTFCILINCSFAADEPIEIVESNWKQIEQGEWMVEFFAPWCPACRQLTPKWTELAAKMDELNIKVGHVDITKNAGLTGRFSVTSLPTIYHVIDGTYRIYASARQVDRFVQYIKDKEWQNTTPVSSWKAPNSVTMSSLSLVYKAATVARGVHDFLVEQYHLPIWTVYLLFGVVTVTIGILAGTLLVFCVDCCFPVKPSAKKPHVEVPPPSVDSTIVDDDDSGDTSSTDADADANGEVNHEASEVRRRKVPARQDD